MIRMEVHVEGHGDLGCPQMFKDRKADADMSTPGIEMAGMPSVSAATMDLIHPPL